MTLAVGDKVRFLEDYNESSVDRRVNKGEEGVIESIYSNGTLAQVNLGGSRKDIGVFLKRLEKVEPPALRVGDRVRVTTALPPGFDSAGEAVPGAVGVIVGTSASYPYRVRLDGFKRGHLFRARELEKIEEPEPKFKVGDRVRLLHKRDGISAGSVGTVLDSQPTINPENRFIYTLDFPEFPGVGMYEFRLEKFEPVPFKLEHGDKVVNRKTGRVGRVLLGPVSKELKVYDEKPNIQAPDAPTARALEEYEEHFPGTYDLFKAKDNPWQ